MVKEDTLFRFYKVKVSTWNMRELQITLRYVSQA